MQTCSKLELTLAVDLTQRQVANIDNFSCGWSFIYLFQPIRRHFRKRSRFNRLSDCRISGKVRRPKTDIL